MNTTIKAKNRILSLVLALCLLMGMTLYLPGPLEVAAADVDIGTADDLTVDTSGTTYLVYFGHNRMQNKDWQGNESDADGTYSPIAWRVVCDNDDGTLTLLSNQLLATRPYDSAYDHKSWSDSEIAGYLNGDFKAESFDNREVAAMVDEYSTAQETGYNNLYPFTPNQTIVLPSVAEVDGGWFNSNSDRVAYNLSNSSDDWWLRSPGAYPNSASFVYPNGYVDPGDVGTGLFVYNTYGIRPAFRLDLSSVLFTSDAVGGKSSVGVANTLLSVPKAPTGAVKLTVLDSGITLDGVTLVSSTNGTGTLTFSYNTGNATTNTDQFISCVLVDSSGSVKYYGKLEDLSSTASGAVDVPLSGVTDGDYTLKIFSEQANGNQETDYAGGIHTFDITVENSSGTVGSSDATLVSVAGQHINAGSEAGDSNAPKTASITLGYSWNIIADNDLVAATGATAELYADDTYTTPQSPVTLQDGPTELYIKVTSANELKELYYHVTATRQSGGSDPGPNPEPTTEPSATIDSDTLQMGGSTTLRISLGQSGGLPMATGANIAVDDEDVVTVEPDILNDDGDVTVTATGVGETDIRITFEGVSGHDKTIPVKVTGSGGGSSGSRRSSSRSSGGSSTPDAPATKTQLPASAFNWDGDRTLTIDHDSISVLGLLSVRWDDATLTRGTDFGVYQGSVIIRFGEEFMAAQSPGEHTVKVEFLNHTGEAAVTVGDTGGSGDVWDDNDTHNPSTGGYPDGSYPGTDNPNTGDGRNIWSALLLGSLGGIVLVVRRLKPVA